MKIFFFLISSLIHWFFRSEFSNLHVFLNFPKFLSLICSFITVQSEKMLNVILVFKILLNCFLSHCMILENVPERLSFHQQTISFCSFMSRKLTHIGHRHDKLNQVEGTQSQIPRHTCTGCLSTQAIERSSQPYSACRNMHPGMGPCIRRVPFLILTSF